MEKNKVDRSIARRSERSELRRVAQRDNNISEGEDYSGLEQAHYIGDSST